MDLDLYRHQPAPVAVYIKPWHDFTGGQLDPSMELERKIFFLRGKKRIMGFHINLPDTFYRDVI
jgi:hypothetical protein